MVPSEVKTAARCGPPFVKLLVMQGLPLLAKEKGEYTGKNDTPRSYTKLGALDGDYLLDFSFIPPKLNLPTHA